MPVEFLADDAAGAPALAIAVAASSVKPASRARVSAGNGSPLADDTNIGGRPSKPESGNGLVLRVTHHKYAAPLIVSTAGTVNLWLAATAS